MPKSIFKDMVKNINGPRYDYVEHIKYPIDFPVKNDGSIFSNTMMDDISALIYYVNTMIFSNSEESNYSPYKTIRTLNGPVTLKKWRKTGGILGQNYDIVVGKCPNGSDKKLKIRNKKGFEDWQLLGIPKNAFGKVGFGGVLPGLLQNIADINPYNVFEMAEGKSSLIECFNNNKKYNYISFFIIIVFFIILIINKN